MGPGLKLQKKKRKQQAMKLKTNKQTNKEKTSGINETKHIFFEKINNINKWPARLSRKKYINYQYQKLKKKY